MMETIALIANGDPQFKIQTPTRVGETNMGKYLIYESKIEEITILLKDKEIYLLKAIKEGVINVSNIGFMKPTELNPDKYNHIINKKKKEEDKINNIATSSVYTCKKCRKNRCQVTQRQTRSADEPATIFVKCMECSHEFSFN